MKIEIFKGRWTREDCKKNPNAVFVIGDNSVRVGKGGQAVIRGEHNVMGIVTKRLPSHGKDAYYYDDDFNVLTKLIDYDINAIKIAIESELNDYDTVMLSENGYGNGLARLYETSPKGFDYLCKRLKEEFNFDNPRPR